LSIVACGHYLAILCIENFAEGISRVNVFEFPLAYEYLKFVENRI
jgi:hypothetical protein